MTHFDLVLTRALLAQDLTRVEVWRVVPARCARVSTQPSERLRWKDTVTHLLSTLRSPMAPHSLRLFLLLLLLLYTCHSEGALWRRGAESAVAGYVALLRPLCQSPRSAADVELHAQRGR